MRNECYYCKREIQHGGKCSGKDGSVPCLAYEKDQRGRREWLNNTKLEVPLGWDVPRLYEPCSGWQIEGVDKTITIAQIHKVEWHKNKSGLQGIWIWADMWYWSDENGELPLDRPRLRLIKTDSKGRA